MGSSPGDDFGAFFVRLNPCGPMLKIIASGGNDEVAWEHVSVSLPKRCPTWEEMAAIKDLFWDDEEAVAQFHPPKSDYVTMHPFCLHMWKPLEVELPLPPSIAVGLKDCKFELDRDGNAVALRKVKS